MVFDGDILVRRRMYAIIDMCAYGATKTLYPTASGSLATAALSLAASDHAVREALSLVGSGEPTWPRIYDIIEFLGGPRLIAEAGLASKKKTACVKQTANHYRRLGDPQNAKSLPIGSPNGQKRYPAGTSTSTNVRLTEAEVHAVSMACRYHCEFPGEDSVPTDSGH